MSRFSLISAAALAIAAAAAPAVSLAQPAHENENTCFARRFVEGFSAPDNQTVYLRVGVSDIYRLKLFSDCLDLTYRNAIGLEDQPASAFICSPLEATVVYRHNGMSQRCPVTEIHKLTPAEIAAAPKGELP